MEKFDKLTDDQLVNLYMNGTCSAFDALLDRYKDRLYSYIYYSVRRAELADDIFQETFVKAIAYIQQGRYCSNGKFYGWITRIAHNIIIDNYRRSTNDHELSRDEISYQLYGNGDYFDNCDEREHEAANNLKQLRNLIDLLPENQQEILRMRIYEDVSFKDIAAQKNISINTALGRMRYAILNMRRLAAEHNIMVYNL